MKKLIALVPVVALVAAACAPTDGHPLVHNAGQWPAVVVENHTSSAFPVSGSFGVWGISGEVFGSCASQPGRICYRFVEGETQPHSNASWTTWSWYDSGPHTGQKFVCTTTINPAMRTINGYKRMELVEHEIGHCYGLAHTAQGAGTMEPTITGEHAIPTDDEKNTLRSLYVG